MRTIIDLPEEQVIGLVNWCRRERISKAEAIRRALKKMLSGQQVVAREDAFGAWAKRGVGSRKMVEKLRSEWEK
jgi:Arc/MetJ-type ribon-helix-helix transcriptional regulator